MALYDDYATCVVKDIPKENLKTLVNIFMVDASVNMGNDFSDETLERAIFIIETNFRFLHLCYVASAFKKGSLGQYGAGRLVPRTIYGWLNEITAEYNRDTEHKRLNADDATVHFKDLERYPLGRAICWKIDHVSESEWDKIPLKEVAELLGKGIEPTLLYFGINN
jgi:hypothetical protein